MNELLFFMHTLIIIGMTFGALRLGKEALIALIALFAVFANLFVLKQTILFGLMVTCSDVFSVGCILGLNLIQEVFGKEEAKKACIISFFAMAVFAILSQIHLYYQQISLDSYQAHYEALFSMAPRLIIVSLATFYIVQRIDLLVYGTLKNVIKSWQLASAISLIIVQFIDTALFTFFGLYGIVEDIGSVIVFSYLIKVLVIITLSLSTLAMNRFFSFSIDKNRQIRDDGIM